MLWIPNVWWDMEHMDPQGAGEPESRQERLAAALHHALLLSHPRRNALLAPALPLAWRMHFANNMDAPSADDTKIIVLASHLIEIDLAAIAAYRAALRRLSSSGARRVLEGQLGDHERHVDALSELVASLGAMPPAEGDFSSLISTGKVLFGNFAGDTGILAAMRSNELAPLHAYQAAFAETRLWPKARALIGDHLRDEHRHAGLIGLELERLPSLTLSSICEAV